MGWSDKVMQAVTLGGHGRLESAVADYQQAYAVYEAQHNEAVKLETAVNNGLMELGTMTQVAFRTLRRAIALLRAGPRAHWNLRGVDKSVRVSCPPKALAVLHDFSLASNAAAGLGAGSAVAIGSWSLVSLLGTASTGAAIGALHGVAATSAILAWFGGGSLAMGGLGMMGGSLALGGIVLAPVLAFVSWKSHSKAKEVLEQVEKTKQASAEIIASLPRMRMLVNAIADKQRTVEQGHGVLLHHYRVARRELFPRALLSRLWRWLRSLLWGAFYIDIDAQSLARLEWAIDQFVEHFAKAPPQTPLPALR